MKTFLSAVFVLFAAILPGVALSQDAGTVERVAEAKAIFDAIGLQKQMDQMSTAMADGMAKQFSAAGNKGGDPRAIRIGMEEGMRAMGDGMNAPGGLVDVMAEAYASQFTFEELRQIREFYVSPVGRHVLAATPELMRQMMPRMIEISKAAIPAACERTRARMIAEKVEGGEKMTCPAAAQ